MKRTRFIPSATLRGLVVVFAVGVFAVGVIASAEEPTKPVDFNSQIRPILTQYCTSCHGGVKSAGGVSFVSADRVLPPDGWVIEPGDPQASALIERITSDDPDMRMPPPDEHPDPVPDEEIELVRRWIAEGARWDSIWSIVPLRSSPKAPSGWSRQPLDDFVHARIIASDRRPSAEAPPTQWLRRASFDLIGLPPSLEQVHAFEQRLGRAPDETSRELVYEGEVDRLLASHRFGERWASVWMDLARYADSQGFEKDPHRDMWPYRDWLIEAFNRDMPYDEFTIKQLAGDLLPDPTADDLIATAFHRNTMTNTEGGTDDEEFRVAAVIDRISTTWTVWQATTMGCVQCHSHPYDAIAHEEFYASMALFNNTADWDLNDDYPFMKVPEAAQQDAAEPRIADRREAAANTFRSYEHARHNRNQIGWSIVDSTPWTPIKPRAITTSSGKMEIQGNEVIRGGGTFPTGVTFELDATVDMESVTALRIRISPLFSDPLQWPEQGSVLTQLKLSWSEPGGTPDPDAGEKSVEKSVEKSDGEPVETKPEFTEVPLADVFVDAITSANDPRESLKPSNEGVGGYPKLTGLREAVFVLKEPLALPSDGRLRLTMHQGGSVTGNLATPLRRFTWSASDDPKWTQLLASDDLQAATQSLDQAEREFRSIRGAKLPIVWSLPESKPRATRQFIRGNWLDKADEISPGIPELFVGDADVKTDEVDDRLKFARWLVSDANPLAARVWANRIWEQLFGLGIVETLEDFGSSGLLPTDGELLDHLAIRLRDHHRWHLKPMLRELVLSSTYRQTNQSDRQTVQSDPQNRYLARGPRTRLSAEMVRDQALAVAGRLSDQIGGPSVMPPQPDGIWASVYSDQKWVTPEDEQRYRRGLYTYWRRTSPYPSFLTFDAPTRDLCSARRIATNTPLQALVTLNDPVYVESAEALAARAIQSNATPRHAMQWMARVVTQSSLSEIEADQVLALYEDLAGSDDVGDDVVASQSATSTAQKPKADMDAHAMGIVANTLLNWDKALTK